MSAQAADVLEELATLTAEFPIAADELPLHHLAAIYRCSPEAIALAEELGAAPEWPPVDVANEVAEWMSVGESRQLTERSDVPGECGALRQWRREIAANARRTTDSDALAISSCHEATAREDMSAGLWAAAKQQRDAALDIIIETAARKAVL
jgi:hypothetical protein